MKDEYVVVHLNKDVRLEHSSTSKGNQIKWFLDESYYKADSFGYEGLAEWVVSKFSEAIVDLSYTPYNCCLIEEDGCQYNGCYSKSFLKEDESFISFAHILELKYLDYSKHIKSGFQSSFQFICDEIKMVTGMDVSCYMAQNLYLDAIILNEDRHLNNFGVVKGNGYYRLAPVFDNGLSLLSDLSVLFSSVFCEGSFVSSTAGLFSLSAVSDVSVFDLHETSEKLNAAATNTKINFFVILFPS